MELQDFMGKVVISSKTNARYVLKNISSPCIDITSEKPNKNGYYSSYRIKTINQGDPISSGHLVFEDPSLTEPFIKAYSEYIHSKAAYYDEIGYWMRAD